MELTTKQFKEKVLNSDKPVLVECWASWCLPCKQIEASLKRLKEEYAGRCNVYKINIDRNPVISRDYTVKGLPTVMTFFDGKELERKVGSISDNDLKTLAENAIQSADASGTQTEEAAMSEEEEQKIIEQRLKDLNYM